LAYFWPESPEEQASKPRYLHDQATEDPDTALDLIELEQTRLLELFSDSFSIMREQTNIAPRLDALKDAFDTLSGTIRETITDLTALHRLSLDAYNRLDCILNIQHSMEAAAAEIHGLGLEFHDLRQTEAGKRFARSAIEGLDFILMVLTDVVKNGEKEDAAMLATMTSEDGNGIAAVRSAYLAEESGLDKTERMKLLAAANHCERLIWLFREIGSVFTAIEEAT
jgi:phosphate:Na+ symporter